MTREVCIKTSSPPASLPFKDQVTEQETVKSSIAEFQALSFANSGKTQESMISTFLLFHFRRSPATLTML